MSNEPSSDQAATEQQSGGLEVVSEGDSRSSITEPTKLMRIAIMLRELQEEVRRADPDEAGRQRLRAVQERAFEQMRSVLSDDLQDELDRLMLPLDSDTPTESEVRLAQAQMIGWLEGLFQGIQAAVFNQQVQAREQLQQMRQRQLPSGAHGGGRPGEERHGTGQYL